MKDEKQNMKPDFACIPIFECLGALHFPGCVQFQETHPTKQELNAELQPNLKLLSIKFQFKKLDTFVCLQGVPKKTLVSVQRLLEALKSELQMKVG